MAQQSKRGKAAPPVPSSGPKRGRPTPDRAAEIDGAIREAALALFLELGFEAASMDAIALQAAVSKGTLYARYENKELLFRTVLEDELKRWSQRAGRNDHLLPEELGPRLRHHARVLIEVFTWPEYRRIARLLAAAAPTLPSVAQYWEEIGTKRYLRFLAMDMAKAAGAKDVDWDFYAKVFLFTISASQRAREIGADGHEGKMTDFADRVIAMIEQSVMVAR